MGNDIHKERTGVAGELYEEAKAAHNDKKARDEFIKSYNDSVINKAVETIIEDCRTQAKLGRFSYWADTDQFVILPDPDIDGHCYRKSAKVLIHARLKDRGFDIDDGGRIVWR